MGSTKATDPETATRSRHVGSTVPSAAVTPPNVLGVRVASTYVLLKEKCNVLLVSRQVVVGRG